jgi:hypothetical protein
VSGMIWRYVELLFQVPGVKKTSSRLQALRPLAKKQHGPRTSPVAVLEKHGAKSIVRNPLRQPIDTTRRSPFPARALERGSRLNKTHS